MQVPDCAKKVNEVGVTTGVTDCVNTLPVPITLVAVGLLYQLTFKLGVL